MLLLLIALIRILATLTVPTVSANQALLAADTNVHINQTNTNTTDIATLKTTPTVSGGATFNGSPTSITAAHDVTVNGTLNVPNTLNGNTIQFALGQVTRWAKFTGTGSTTPTFFNHNLGVVPDVVLLTTNGTSAVVHTVTNDYGSMTSSQTKITADAGFIAFVGLAIKF